MNYHFSSLDEQREVQETETALDYRPLSKEEIARLLQIAQRADSWETVNSIQIRLCQGIVGYVTPRSQDDQVAAIENRLVPLFLDNRHRGADPVLVDQLYKLMHPAI